MSALVTASGQVRAPKRCAECAGKFWGIAHQKYCGNQCKVQVMYRRRTARERAFRRANPLPEKSVRERLLESSVPEPTTGCWLWTKATTRGYGQMKVDGRMRRATHLSYETWVGQLPAGLILCHRCDTPECINPDHLFAGTHGDNVADSIAKGRRLRADGTPFVKHDDATVELAIFLVRQGNSEKRVADWVNATDGGVHDWVSGKHRSARWKQPVRVPEVK